jgi:hypothetical protein
VQPIRLRDPVFSLFSILTPVSVDRVALHANRDAAWTSDCPSVLDKKNRKNMRTLFCIALLAIAGHTYAQSVGDDTDLGGQYLTVPTLPAPNKEAFNWDAAPPESVGASTGKATTYPTQFVNGEFNVTTGWDVYQSYFSVPQPYTGPVYTGYFPEGVAYLAGKCINPNGVTVCPIYGSIAQTVRVVENMRLSFDWYPGFEQTGFPPYYTYVESPIYLTIIEASTGRILKDSFAPAAANLGDHRKHSEIDLTLFAGLNVKFVFSIRSFQYDSQVGNPSSTRWSATEAWVDNIKLISAPPSNYNGQAQTGNWYNPVRSGSGWDLRRAPNGTFYAIWFAFDEARKPVWYISGQGTFGSGILDVPLYGCTRANGIGTCTASGRVQLSLRSATAGVMRFDFYGQGTPGSWDGAENFEFLVGNGGSYSGHFFTNDAADTSWGITTLSYYNYSNQLQLMAPIYYYDGAGQPTWSIAAQQFTNNAPMSVDRLTGGLCPTCPGTYPAITKTPVGTMTLNFGANQSSLTGETNLSNPGWVRSARPFYKLGN